MTETAIHAEIEQSIPVAGTEAQLARRYATALYELAQDKQALDQVAENMRGLGKLVNESAAFREVLHDPRLPRATQMEAMKTVAENAGLHDLTKNFLALVAQNRRLSLLPAMAEAFLGELARRRGEVVANVTVAQPLSSAQQQKLEEALRRVAGEKLALQVSEDRSLIGGFMVRIGSHLVDASLKSKLARLARHMKEAA